MNTSNHILETVLGSRGEGLYQRVVCVGHDGECGVQQSWADDCQASAEATLHTKEIVLNRGSIYVTGVDEYGIESWGYDEPNSHSVPIDQDSTSTAAMDYAIEHRRGTDTTKQRDNH